jgi:drug/metabolite transporter (DMT)-like permease
MFWLLGFHVVPALGGVTSVWVLRVVATVGLGAAAWPARQSLRLPRPGMVWMLMAIGALDVGAYLANNFGMEFRHVSIVTVIASLYAAVTVLLAAVVLREKLNGKQWLGVALIFAGVVILSA